MDGLLAARTVLAIGHESPDSDAFGFALAIGLAVEELGGRATVVSSDPVPSMYDFMPHIGRVRADPDPDLAYDLIVVGDSGDLGRVGRVAQEHAELFGRVPIMVIDHHASNVGFGAVDWLDPTAAATCEMVALLLPRLGLPMDAAGGAIAANLMAGVVGDTAMFQHPNATPRTLRVASELVAAGAPLVGHRAAALPDQAECPAAPVRHRAVAAGDGRGRSTGVGDAGARRPGGGRCGARSSPRGSSTCWPSRAPRRSPSCSGTWATGHASAPGPARAVSTPSR